MAQFNRKVTMTITSDDRAWLSFGNYVLAEIADMMIKEGAETLENTHTGEVIEEEEIEKAYQIIDSLLDAQESWTWELV